MKKLIILLITITCFITSCRKECRMIRIKKPDCTSGFSKMKDLKSLITSSEESVKIYRETSYGYCIGDSLFINNQEMYDSVFCNGSKPFGVIDFSARSLIGVLQRTSVPADDYKSKVIVCINEEQKEAVFRINYQLGGKCAGSGIAFFIMDFWVSTPKIPDDYTINYELNEINQAN